MLSGDNEKSQSTEPFSLAGSGCAYLTTAASVVRKSIAIPGLLLASMAGGRAAMKLGTPGYDPFSPAGANFNATVDATVRDPISGTPAHRANLCEVRPVAVS